MMIDIALVHGGKKLKLGNDNPSADSALRSIVANKKVNFLNSQVDPSQDPDFTFRNRSRLGQDQKYVLEFPRNATKMFSVDEDCSVRQNLSLLSMYRVGCYCDGVFPLKILLSSILLSASYLTFCKLLLFLATPLEG